MACCGFDHRCRTRDLSNIASRRSRAVNRSRCQSTSSRHSYDTAINNWSIPPGRTPGQPTTSELSCPTGLRVGVEGLRARPAIRPTTKSAPPDNGPPFKCREPRSCFDGLGHPETHDIPWTSRNAGGIPRERGQIVPKQQPEENRQFRARMMLARKSCGKPGDHFQSIEQATTGLSRARRAE
jgi:hypothetical protein